MAGSDWLKSETIRFLNQFALYYTEVLFFIFIFYFFGAHSFA